MSPSPYNPNTTIVGMQCLIMEVSAMFFIRKSVVLMGICIVSLVSLMSLAPRSEASDWVYSVRKGDTLWDLCKTYTHVSNCWLKIGDYNGVEYPRRMPAGTRIRFPTYWLKNPPSTVKVNYVSGTVFIKRTDSSAEITEKTNVGVTDPNNGSLVAPKAAISAEEGSQLSIGDSIWTEQSSSATLLFADGSILIMEENSFVTMDLLSLSGNTPFVDTRVNLLRGAVRTQVPKQFSISEANSSKVVSKEPTPNNTPINIPSLNKSSKPKIKRSFKVETPSAIAAVRGTEFRVSVLNSGKDSTSEVYSGVIGFSKNHSTASITSKNDKSVRKKYGIISKEKEPLANPVELLDAPQILSSQKKFTDSVSFNWAVLPDAELYVTALFDAKRPNQILQQEYVSVPQVEYLGLNVSCYLLLVRGIDSIQLQGIASRYDFCVVQKPSATTVSIIHDKSYNHSNLTWQKHDQASEYLLEFSSNENFSEVGKSVPAYGENYSISVVEKRLYDFVRVRVISKDGAVGLASLAVKTK